MATSQADIDRLVVAVAGLNLAIADGVRQVTIGGQTVTYNTTDSLITARDDMQAQLKAAQAELAVSGNALASPRGRLMYLHHGGRGYQ